MPNKNWEIISWLLAVEWYIRWRDFLYCLILPIHIYGLIIDDIRGGQGYDNGFNMKVKKQGGANPTALYMTCACQSLNHTLFDMAKSCCIVVPFLIVQRIYVICWVYKKMESFSWPRGRFNCEVFFQYLLGDSEQKCQRN